MEFYEALLENIQDLTDKAYEFRQRADKLERKGMDSEVTINGLMETCEEIKRLNARLERELEMKRNALRQASE